MTNFAKLEPKVVLGVAAHPDDLDVTASASFAAFTKQGAKAYYLILTDGGSGSSNRSETSDHLSEIRRQEQRKAASLVGVSEVFFCNYADGTLQCSMDVKRDICRYIRKLKPDVVITMDPALLYSSEIGLINHPDHRAAGQATLDSVFPLARDHMSFPELLEEGLEPHKVSTILLTNFEKGNFAVNVTDTLDLKFQAMAAHASQFPKDLSHIKKMFTESAAANGSSYGYTYAEKFIRVDVRLG